MSEKASFAILTQVIEAVKYMNSVSYCHRALSLENVMLTDNNKAVIIGFSGATTFDSHKMTAKYGSPMYMAPEIFRGGYSQSCDIWSIGVIFFSMIAGAQPFTADSLPGLIKRIKKGKYWKHSAWKKLPADSKDFLSKVLKKDSHRAKLTEILELPYIKVHLRKNTRLERMRTRSRIGLIYNNTNRAALSAHVKYAVFRVAKTFKNFVLYLLLLNKLGMQSINMASGPSESQSLGSFTKSFQTSVNPLNFL